MNDKYLQNEIQQRVHEKLTPLFVMYNLDPGDLEVVLKWKPMVLILGNYSSGKSTMVNEILGMEVQRTGQAPTDDCFTVITAPDENDSPGEIPGATLVNDENLPFSHLRDYGEQLLAHIQMKKINSPMLENLAIIDSPGMVDSVTEKGRGYNFPGVVGDLAKLADLVVLMFDPHKAGTIKETYSTIRTTLPETSAEDRIVFVMSRIDECDNLGDLVRSYGTLCWNLSQMTGRKDIPRIYLTFSPEVTRQTKKLEVWVDERNQLKQKIRSTPELRISHILHNVDKRVNELKLVVEAMAHFGKLGRALLMKTCKFALGLGLVNFFLLDVFCKEFFKFPRETLISSLLSRSAGPGSFLIPTIGAVIVFILSGLWFLKWQFPRHIDKCKADPDRLVTLKTDYRKFKWSRTKKKVQKLLDAADIKDLGFIHQKRLQRVEEFLREDLQRFYADK
ncbi:MAG: dynamin family protein [Desulfobacterales bacterium]|nr:dynamin family protein [Desulfobacterales bacterium]